MNKKVKGEFNYIGWCFYISIIIGTIGITFFLPSVPSGLHWIGIPIMFVSFGFLMPIFRAIIRGY